MVDQSLKCEVEEPHYSRLTVQSTFLWVRFSVLFQWRAGLIKFEDA